MASPTPSTPAPSTTEPATFDAPAGATLTLSHNDLGEQPGRVMLRLAAMTVRCDVLGWESTKVTFRLPEVLVEQPLAARLEVLMASGKPAVSYAVRLVAEPKVVVHEENSNATAAIPSPLVVNKYAAQDSELGLPVPAPSLPALNAVPLAN
ncbi:MAG: hypothetical protein HY000_35545 [Planctomycetes bacterium]|nr:hypothetical protein [Planctomycetota bacterium]